MPERKVPLDGVPGLYAPTGRPLLGGRERAGGINSSLAPQLVLFSCPHPAPRPFLKPGSKESTVLDFIKLRLHLNRDLAFAQHD